MDAFVYGRALSAARAIRFNPYAQRMRPDALRRVDWTMVLVDSFALVDVAAACNALEACADATRSGDVDPHQRVSNTFV